MMLVPNAVEEDQQSVEDAVAAHGDLADVLAFEHHFVVRRV